ncbi:MAG: hypothetical protein COX02_01625 [Candidatus Vogelbacteria bacterium CG22_combo_CG10-13_8_21_14_all_37_9]|uniref:DedA family protein n=1 Tax=Candidatus Vogelbacteria bacterium CG22_combo_CG10-13_8_21_14_all_37_9 TaxID=1975046 RepID=A0A2H0BKI5_9BACT|nr:MAG: hypothetical protein BK005_00540 [bacterium CG10_37_50]PIP58187.1 MAG: hypothetical protein COX02_01625 [Candidatus Vogelbacteria bacterium CG22_combo_CG10-13_8_21_14_all_37_9]
MFNSAIIITLLLHYRYWILFPLATLEGPLVALVIGFLIHQGIFAFWPVYLLLLSGDLIPDSIYFFLGRWGNQKQLLQKYFNPDRFVVKNFSIIEKMWQKHPFKTMFFSKLAYGLSIPFLISAGLVKMTYLHFIIYALPITLFQYALLLFIGYYLGQSYTIVTPYIQNTGLVITGFLLIFFGLYLLFTRYAKKQIIKESQE